MSAKRRFRETDGYSVRDLCHAANDHQIAALWLFDYERPQLFDSAGYLAHLAIELFLKAALLHLTKSFPAKHDLKELEAELAASKHSLNLTGDSAEMLGRLNSFSSLRYPDPTGSPPIMSTDRKAVHRLMLEIFEAMPFLRREIDLIDHTRKGGRVLMSRPKG